MTRVATAPTEPIEAGASDRAAIVSGATDRPVVISGATERAGLISPRNRGRLEVTDRVVERIASQVASEVSGVSHEASGLGRLTRRLDSSRPGVKVQLTSAYVDLTINVSVLYPRSVQHTCDEIRRQVVSKVERLAGVPVRRVDINVGELVYHGKPAPVSAPQRRALGPGPSSETGPQ